jgi:hypothetical protein
MRGTDDISEVVVEPPTHEYSTSLVLEETEFLHMKDEEN